MSFTSRLWIHFIVDWSYPHSLDQLDSLILKSTACEWEQSPIAMSRSCIEEFHQFTSIIKNFNNMFS
jgi:hypothetical protein